MAKKRTSLDSLFSEPKTEIKETIEITETSEVSSKVENIVEKSAKVKKEVETPKENKIVKQTVYLPNQVYEQLRLLAFEERKKMHDYLVEGLDRVFKNRGLKSFSELNKQ